MSSFVGLVCGIEGEAESGMPRVPVEGVSKNGTGKAEFQRDIYCPTTSARRGRFWLLNLLA